MKGSGFVAIAVAAMLSAPALAADLPTKAPSRAPVVMPFSWTGFYIGGTAGAAWSNADPSLNIVNGALPLFRPADIAPLQAFGSQGFSRTSGGIFGGKAGYNQQWGFFVLGLEGDISSFRFNRSNFVTGNPFTAPAPPPDFASFNNTVSTTWLATVRPRIGYAADRALFYATGGAAFANVKFSDVYNAFSPLGVGSGDHGASSTSQTRTGWTAGGGIDYALTTNWIVSVEYLHVDLGSIAASTLASSANGTSASLNFSTKLRSDILHGAISYKF